MEKTLLNAAVHRARTASNRGISEQGKIPVNTGKQMFTIRVKLCNRAQRAVGTFFGIFKTRLEQ